MIEFSTEVVYVFIVLFIYLWIVGGLGWKSVYENSFDRTFTWRGTTILVILWVPLTIYSAIMHTIDVVRDR